MKKNPWKTLVVVVVVLFGLLALLRHGMRSLFMGEEEYPAVARGNSILHLQLEGVILDGRKFLKQLNRYRKDPKIKAVVVEINSPGGVVGPSQEIYQEINRVREDFDKPVVAYSSNLMASGALYSAVAADQIVVTPGALVGSIGVIMEFLNLEKLYDWAKVQRYTLVTGKYKDSGAEYRSMREDERKVFQDLINNVFEQFVEAVAEGRELPVEEVKKIADGRVFTGDQAVGLKLADMTGTLEDAYRLAADLAEIEDYEVFDPPKRRPSILDLLLTNSGSGGEDEASETSVLSNLSKVLRARLNHRPLFLMPGVL